MEFLASSFMVRTQHFAKRLQLYRFYLILHYIRDNTGGCTQNNAKHMGFRIAACMGKYRTGRDVQPDLPM